MLDDNFEQDPIGHGGAGGGGLWRFECGKGYILNMDVARDGATYQDDLTGQPLDPKLVLEARQKELDYFASKGVWRKAPIAECRREMGRNPISVRWVDGDDVNPNIRSRLVARQIRGPGEESTFAPTPRHPLKL